MKHLLFTFKFNISGFSLEAAHKNAKYGVSGLLTPIEHEVTEDDCVGLNQLSFSEATLTATVGENWEEKLANPIALFAEVMDSFNVSLLEQLNVSTNPNVSLYINQIGAREVYFAYSFDSEGNERHLLFYNKEDMPRNSIYLTQTQISELVSNNKIFQVSTGGIDTYYCFVEEFDCILEKV